MKKDAKAGEGAPKFPVLTVRLALAVMVIALCAATYFTIKIGDELKRGMRAQIEVLTAAERVQHYGNVLELSIRTVATYGDRAAAAQYKTVLPQLRSTLNELRDDVSLPENQRALNEVGRVEDALVAMELEALERASEGELQEARQIISSPRYNLLLANFEDGLADVERRAAAYVAATDEKLDWYLDANLALTIAGIGLIILGWIAILGPAKSWGRQLNEARHNAETATVALEGKQIELNSLNVQLFEQARRDPLTKLQTRLKLNEDLESIWPRAARYGEHYCAVMCDIDYFKQYNDTYGHIAGDDVLRQVANALSSVCRGGDQLYRFGGEEFVIILSDCSTQGGAISADRYRDAVEAMKVTHAGSPYGIVTISLGVAALEPNESATIQRWLNDADVALYEAKRAGRNRVAGSQPATT